MQGPDKTVVLWREDLSPHATCHLPLATCSRQQYSHSELSIQHCHILLRSPPATRDRGRGRGQGRGTEQAWAMRVHYHHLQNNDMDMRWTWSVNSVEWGVAMATTS